MSQANDLGPLNNNHHFFYLIVCIISSILSNKHFVYRYKSINPSKKKESN